MNIRPYDLVRRSLAGASAALLIAMGIAVVSETSASASTVPAAQNPTQCAGSLSLQNGSFELPTRSIGVAFVNESAVPGWQTTSTDNLIEFWNAIGNPRNYPAGQGAQFVELNARQPSTLYQDVATTPGQTLYWSLKHRGREGDDTMRVVIGDSGGSLVDVSGSLVDGTAAWGAHIGSYTVPAGQTSTRFGFQAVNTATGNQTVGNLLDDISFGTGPCLVSTKSVENLTRGGGSAVVGDTLRYTVTTRNDGGNPALRSISTDVLPTGVDFIPGSLRIVSGSGAGALTDASGDDRGQYTSSDRTLKVHLGDGGSSAEGGSIGVSASTSFTFDVRVRTDAAGTIIVNEAQVAFREPVTNTDRTSTTDEVLTPVNPVADLSVVKSAAATGVPGSPFIYTLVVTNSGPSVAQHAALIDTLPAEFTGASVDDSDCTIAASSVACSFGDFAVGASTTVKIAGVWNSTASGTIRNTATVNSSTPDLLTANNTSSADVTLEPLANVSVVKTTSTPNIKLRGEAVFAIKVSNEGPSAAMDVVVDEVIPQGLTVASATSSVGQWSDANHQWSVGTLLPGESATLTVKATATAVGTLINSATVTSSTPDSDASDNAGSSTIFVTSIATPTVTGSNTDSLATTGGVVAGVGSGLALLAVGVSILFAGRRAPRTAADLMS